MPHFIADSVLALSAYEEGYDPIEDRLRAMVRHTIETMFEEELAEASGRTRYGRGGEAKGYRNGHRDRQLVGTLGTAPVRVPRARIEGEEGKAREGRAKALPRYRRLTKSEADQKTARGAVFPMNEALIASVCLSGANTRRVKRALVAGLKGAVSKDVVSRVWRKVKVDWDARVARAVLRMRTSSGSF